MGLLLRGKGAVLAHGFDRPLAAEMDDDQQSWRGGRRHRDTRLRQLAQDRARYRVCLQGAAPLHTTQLLAPLH